MHTQVCMLTPKVSECGSSHTQTTKITLKLRTAVWQQTGRASSINKADKGTRWMPWHAEAMKDV